MAEPVQSGEPARSGPAGTVADRIRRGLSTLTPAERRVGRTLVAGYPVSGLGTVADLAAESSTSSATVVRLAQKLGYDGYPQLQAAVRDELATRTSGPMDRLGRVESAGPDTFERTVAAATSAVDALRETVPHSEFDSAVALLADLRRPVKVLGGRITGLLAAYLHHHLGRARPDVGALSTDERTRDATLLDVARRDVVVAFDVRRYDPASLSVCEAAVGRGAAVVLVTDVVMSPIAALASVVLPARVDAPSPFDSTVALLVLAEALVTATVGALGESAVERMAAWDALSAR